MEPRDYSVFTGTTIDHRAESTLFDIMGDDVSGLTTADAKAYLDQHPNGTLHNDIFDTDSFITLDMNGNYLFYHGVDDKIMSWDWSELDSMIEDDRDREFMKDWWYHPGDQMEVTNGGFKWWSDLRSGKYSKPKTAIARPST